MPVVKNLIWSQQCLAGDCKWYNGSRVTSDVYRYDGERCWWRVMPKSLVMKTGYGSRD